MSALYDDVMINKHDKQQGMHKCDYRKTFYSPNNINDIV